MGVYVSFNPKTSNTYAGSQNITIAEKILAGGNGTPVFNVSNLSWNDTVTADLTAGANPIQVGSTSNLSYGGVAGTTTYLFTRWIDLSMNRFTAAGNSAIYAGALNVSASFFDAIGGNGCGSLSAGRFSLSVGGAGVSAITEAAAICIESPSFDGGTVVSNKAGLRIQNQGASVYAIRTGTGPVLLGDDLTLIGTQYANSHSNKASSSNAFLDLAVSGATISRNIADANPALVVNVVSGFGLIMDCRFNGVTKVSCNAAGVISQATQLVAALGGGLAGQRSFVTNALAPVFGAAVVGGGAVGVPVYHDGTSWKVG